MATGRHGVYEDNELNEFKSHLDLTGWDLTYSKNHYSTIRNDVHEIGRGKNHYKRERGRIRQKDIKEREAVNGGYKSSSSRGDSGSSSGQSGGVSRWSRRSVRAVDREPGELSSDSGSESAIDFGSVINNDYTVKHQNGGRAPLNIKKSKCSPTSRDKDDFKIKRTPDDGSAIGADVRAYPPSRACNPSPVVTNGGAKISPEQNCKADILSSLLLKPPPHVEASISTDGLHSSTSPYQQPCQSNEHDIELLDEDDYLQTSRNISTSRWADEANSPEEEMISDVERFRKRRKTEPIGEILDSRSDYKSISPEFGEIPMEGSLSLGSKSSESDGGSRDRQASDPVNAGEHDYMEVDYNQRTHGASISETCTESEDLIDSLDTPKCAVPPQKAVNMLQGCRSVDEFERLNRIDEGTYGVVYRAKDRKTGEIVALKKVKMEKEREGFPLTSLREINILLSFHHPSIINVKEVVMGSSLDNIFMVMEYMEHDLKGLMETMKQPFSQSEVKCLMIQLLEGVKYLHENWVLHRDLKASNILLNNRGELKICDFGLSRQYGSPLKPCTSLVVTLWYRAPELLLGAKKYSTAIDIWSLGCIMAELLSKEPLFNGKSELDQLDKIFRTLGTPSETIWPGFSKLPGVKVNFVKHQYNLLRKKFPATSFTGSPVLSDLGFDLLNKLLTYDPDKRITAEAALNHSWFREVPLPKSKDFMPTFPAQHAQDRRTRRVIRSPDPLEEQRRKELRQGEIGTGGLFG